MKENVVIIGGGIAGLEAAKQLIALGYAPIIVERKSHLGGHVAQWHKLFPDMTPAKAIVEQLISEVNGANIFLNTEIVSANKLASNYIVNLSNGITVRTKAILVASGFDIFDAHKKEEYGYGIYDQVITNKDLEKWFETRVDSRLDKKLQKIGFVHCVGSRDVKAGNSQCSKVCCVTAIKQAIELKQLFPEAEIWCFYMDLRLFGKKYEDFYINAQQEYGIHFVRGRISEVSENIDGNVVVKAEDTLVGKPLKVTLDLLVLMAGMICNSKANRVAELLRLEKDSDGFFRSKDNLNNIVESPRKGIFYAGACTGTKTVPETISEARAAALTIHNYLKD
ncbi:MAG: CoB--CoM heterodisulfide reductase iron-sulfur subunit A family protein [Bacteroidales bacterium]|nr:CoB--CoM heterodisulfide reductase iron-sulfur subunit A family protein [Bacteroidales bacterium]